MWILAVNRTHDSSICLMEDDNIVLHLQEERLTHVKHCDEVVHLLVLIKNYTDHLDVVTFSTLHNDQYDFNTYIALIKYLNIKIGKVCFHHKVHHLLHSYCGFYNSGFDDAVSIVIDGAGSDADYGKENESIITHTFPSKFKNEYKTCVDLPSIPIKENSPNFVKDNRFGVGMVYTSVTQYFGFSALDAGKTMGLSSYGVEDDNIKSMINEKGGNEKLFSLLSFKTQDYEYKNVGLSMKEYDYILYSKDEKDKFRKNSNLAYKLQKEFEDYVYNMILYAVEITGKRNVVYSGGCALNCVANYRILKRLPKDINLYIEPISNDSGITIGSAKSAYVDSLCKTLRYNKVKPNKLQTLYLGQKISYDYILDSNESEKDVTAKEVAELIRDGNIVAICQGRSESGPRALGNRSILFDPRVKDGKEIVNRVKKREWWRPFAGTVLLENAREWFDMDRLEESPHMMYAVDVWEDKRDLIPSITHVDGTCRIQTLRKEYNPNYYELIEEFYKLTNVPILFNTSFNLAGDTIVETIDDAFKTLRESEIEYMYLPEINKLIHVPNENNIC